MGECDACVGIRKLACDRMFTSAVESRVAVSTLYMEGLDDDFPIADTLDQNMDKQERILNTLTSSLGNIGCTLTRDEVRQDVIGRAPEVK